jgi:hypothetical protein
VKGFNTDIDVGSGEIVEPELRFQPAASGTLLLFVCDPQTFFSCSMAL